MLPLARPLSLSRGHGGKKRNRRSNCRGIRKLQRVRAHLEQTATHRTRGWKGCVDLLKTTNTRRETPLQTKVVIVERAVDVEGVKLYRKVYRGTSFPFPGGMGRRAGMRGLQKSPCVCKGSVRCEISCLYMMLPELAWVSCERHVYSRIIGGKKDLQLGILSFIRASAPIYCSDVQGIL